MTKTASARALLEATTRGLAPEPGGNRLVPLIARGAARPETLAALALEQRLVVAADHRAFLRLAQESAAREPASEPFFTLLARGEELAGERLGAFAEACGADGARSAAYVPRPGCQAYPAYVAWLALNGAPADVLLVLHANFSAFGGYCAAVAAGLRRHYGFSDEACGFFDFFAEPAPELERSARTAVRAALDAGRVDEHLVHRYGRLLQAYEAMFWASLEEPAPDGA
ncbi:transcriptional regulator [Streptomyces sp. CRN 30]|uniref:transcriptional regulator n=1 Tax=Streptomyces sp. CRN 30 TaxID=3075613 RepID=UPI002A815DC1|nr:transcriptional regulator [Streptomyces sp. CRN 30]